MQSWRLGTIRTRFRLRERGRSFPLRRSLAYAEKGGRRPLLMGCTSSRPDLDDPHTEQQWHDWSHSHSAGKSISMATSHPPASGLLHDLPIASSIYGFDMSPTAKHAQVKVPGYGGSPYEGSREDKNSMKQMLQVLESLDMGEPDGSAHPSRPSQVSSILEDLKPDLERQFNQALGKHSFHGGGASAALPLTGKENEKPVLASPTRDVVSSPISRNGGSASPDGIVKTPKSKSSFVSRFLHRSSSSFGSQKRTRKRELLHAKDSEGDTGVSADVTLQSAKGADGSLLFDSDLLDSYESALKEFRPEDWNALKEGANLKPNPSQLEDQVERREDEQMPEASLAAAKPPQLAKKRVNPLEKYDELCPPGGENSVVLYTTSLRGIRKTFEDCNSMRSTLESFQVIVDERDVAMHQGFRNELREMMGNKPVPVPRLFIKGRYIGGAEEVLQLHDDGQLAPLLEGLPRDERGSGQPCDGCGGARFVPCLECSGSRKVVDPDNAKEVIRCPDCNENGLIQCPICS